MNDQSNELAAIKRKIRAALNMRPDRGATEAEAMAALKKVGEWLLQYNLSMNEVMLRDEPCIMSSFQTGSKHRNVIYFVATGIAKLCETQVWFARKPEGIEWNFFGLESDVNMSIYLCDFLQIAEKNAMNEFKQSSTYKNFKHHRKIASNNFKEGFGRRLLNRLKEEAKKKLEEEEAAAKFHAEAMKNAMVEATDAAKAEAVRQKTGTDLISIAKAKRIAEEFRGLGLRLSTVRAYSASTYHSDSHAAGSNAANTVNIGRPIESDARPISGLLK